MDIIQKKQEQINILLKDALDIQSQTQEIALLAGKVSEKFEDIGNIVQKSSKAVAYFAKQIAKKSKYRGISKDVGNITESGVQLIGVGIKAFGGWWGERKKRKSNEKLLPKKQELARSKLEVIQRLIPRIEKDKDSVIKFCRSEASTFIDFNEKNRYDLVINSTKEIFEAYFIFEQSELMCRYLLDEFNAWLKGDHQSSSEMLDATQIYYSCVENLIYWSALPMKKLGFGLPDKLSIGGSLLIADPQISEYSIAFDSISELVSSTCNSKLL